MSAIAIVERAKTAISLGESHFREFKSALHGEPDAKERRELKDIATNISQTLVAFANADGGELLVGVEDNGLITGLPGFSESDLCYLEKVPNEKVHKDTPLPQVKFQRIEIDGKTILYFSVPKSTKFVHVTSDGRCLQRNDLESVPVAAEAVQFDRSEIVSREYDRIFVDGASVDDLDLDLVRPVADQIIRNMSIEKCLQYLDLAEYGVSRLSIRKAALLLFAKNYAKWHPRLQVRIMKVDGVQMLTGEQYNIVADDIISGNILSQVEKSWEAMRPHLVQTRFDKGARFEKTTIYPELACREALLNAIAHRDYSQEGRGIEVYIYNDRLEVKSPGALLSSISLSDIVDQKGAHQSRNTYIARVLRELGYMRELGEGMRRIYKLMSDNELAPPVLSTDLDGFSITLSHKPIYSEKERLFLDQFDGVELDRDMKAVVLLGKDDNVFSTQDIWNVVGIVDTDYYRVLVDKLARLGVFHNHIPRDEAKRMARKQKVPFREFKRFKISTPAQGKAKTGSPHQVESSEAGRCQGKVKWYSYELGYGFILKSDGSEIFFHKSEIDSAVNLREGASVSFLTKSNAKGFHACEVKNS